ncbi:FIVAR domain-containing protein, partial [[Mycoplasma] imitans]|uniref:FIVAR domain-containing protein n=1 Tax=[Mycoplasma] imitans TaxID=29560 RepID=UPI0004833DB3
QNVAKYQDYAKIQSSLTTAYTTAEGVSNKNDATLMNIQDATTALQNAIDKAASDKTEFDKVNSKLVEAYGVLKTTLEGEAKVLETLNSDAYSSIKKHVGDLYSAAKEIITNTLQPASADALKVDTVTTVNNKIIEAISDTSLNAWKTNADMYESTFGKQVLEKSGIVLPEPEMSQETQSSTAMNNEQPANYSFVGYSVDVSGASDDSAPTWNYTKRNIFTIGGAVVENQNGDMNIPPLTDVSWIYSLPKGSKYTLKFTYYGPSSAFLYFPYKLVQSSRSNMIGLDYSLNSAQAKAVEFSAPMNHLENADESNHDTAETSTMKTTTSSETATTSSEKTTNPAPAVNAINVAKVMLTDLKFGDNQIDFTVPDAKVAPMFGNFYITSSDANVDKINDSIFGNTNINDAITVNLLKGYNLASDYSTFFAQYDNAELDGKDPQNRYLVGFIGGNGTRKFSGSGTSVMTPSNSGKDRNLIVYVNAPKDGSYHVSGVYVTAHNRTIKLWTNDENNNFVQLVNLNSGSSSTLKTFDTSKTTSEVQITNPTIVLKKGLNKIVVTGGTADGGNAPNIGNLTFTLMPASEKQEE